MGESLTLHVTVVVLALLLGILAVSETARGALLLAKEMWERVEFLLLPVGGSLFSLWQRRRKQREDAAALRAESFRDQCSVLLVNFDGMRSSCQDGNVVALATLFSRTLRDLLFDNEALLDLVTSAAKRAEEGGGALLPLGEDSWMVLAQINAHLCEVCSVAGNIASVMGQPIERREMIFGLCNDVGSAGRRQLRVYVIPEDQLRQLPVAEDLNLERKSWRRAFQVAQEMAAGYVPPDEDIRGQQAKVTAREQKLPSGMARTWFRLQTRQVGYQ